MLNVRFITSIDYLDTERFITSDFEHELKEKRKLVTKKETRRLNGE